MPSDQKDTMATQTATQSTRSVLDRTKLNGLKALIGEAKCNAAIQRFKGELFACLAASKAMLRNAQFMPTISLAWLVCSDSRIWSKKADDSWRP